MARARSFFKATKPKARTKTRAQKIRSIALEVGFIVFAFILLTRWQTRSLLPQGEAAPAFTLRDLEGNTVSLSDLAGKSTMVHFWATWCGVCKREFSTLNALNEALYDDEALVAIVDSTDAGAVLDFAKKHGLEYPVLLGTPEVRDAYRVQAFPTNYFVDKEGKLVSATVGMSTRLGMASRMHFAR
jgi:peroxiredoxin